MKTVPTILPIYDSPDKQDQSRTGTKMPVFTPRHKLPSLLWNVENDDPGAITGIELMGESIQGSSILNGVAKAYETLSTADTIVVSAINTAGDAEFFINPYFTINVGSVIVVRFTLALTSGQLPTVTLDAGGASQVAVNGYNEIYLVSTGSSTAARIKFSNTSNTEFNTSDAITVRNEITSYFNTTDDYVQDGGGAGWINNATAYDTFTSVNKNITSAIKTTAAGVASCWNVVALKSVPREITIGETLRVLIVLTLNSGTAPKCALQRTDTSVNISNVVTLVNGINYVDLKATATITGFAITIYNENTELSNWSANISRGAKTVLPTLFTSITDKYFQYKGNTLGKLLPFGAYYLKITTLNNYVYYSDKFIVSEIYPNIATSLINGDYDTFTASGTTIASAVSAGGSKLAYTNTINLIKGEQIVVMFFLTQNGGEHPSVTLDLLTSVEANAGLNIITLTSTVSGLNNVIFTNSAATNYSTSEIIIKRMYSSNFIKINFSDTHDLGEILYQDGLTQEVYFEQKLAPPTHEVVEVGEEKNGIFVAEKIITKYKYRIIANVGRELYKALIRLPQHDTISITDEVGNVYVPKVGNVQVIPANWIYYDVCRLEIIFNDNTEYVWTSENNNIT